MQIRTEEFMALKIAIGMLEEIELPERKRVYLLRAVEAIESAEERLAENNRRQAEVMRQRRARKGDVA